MRAITRCCEQKALLFISALLLAVFIFVHSTIHEDAYITFRVIDNFLAGYGLRWNIDERVQVYTHPLWLLIHIPVQYVVDNIYFVSLALSWACVICMLALFYHATPARKTLFLTTYIAFYLLSKTLINYSTSGFENPLLHALLAFFVFGYYRFSAMRRWYYLSLIMSLSVLTRPDVIVFYLPVAAILLFHQRVFPWKQLVLGGAPLVLWGGFSLFYYGFLFPNTKYAKLNTGIAPSEYISLGLHYVKNLFAVDIFSAVFLFLSIVILPWMLLSKKSSDRVLLLSIILGVIAYTVYVIYIGGTYLSGRLLSLPVIASAYVMARLLVSSPWFERRAVSCVSVFLLTAISVQLAYPADHIIKKHCRSCFRGVNAEKYEEKIRLIRVLC